MVHPDPKTTSFLHHPFDLLSRHSPRYRSFGGNPMWEYSSLQDTRGKMTSPLLSSLSSSLKELSVSVSLP